MQSDGLHLQRLLGKMIILQMLMSQWQQVLVWRASQNGAVCLMSSHCRRISSTKSQRFSITLKNGGTDVSSTPNSIASSIQLRCFGVMENIVCRFLLSFSDSLTNGSAGFRTSSDGKFLTAKLLVPQCLNKADVYTIQRFFRKTW